MEVNVTELWNTFDKLNISRSANYTKYSEDSDKCRCSSTDFITLDYCKVCTNCGTIKNENYIVTSHEGNYSVVDDETGEDNNTWGNVIDPICMNYSMSTQLCGQYSSTYKELYQRHKNLSYNNEEYSIYVETEKINNIAVILGIPKKVVSLFRYLFYNFKKSKNNLNEKIILRSSNYKALLMVCFTKACEEFGQPTDLDTLLSIFECTYSDYTKILSFYNNNIEQKETTVSISGSVLLERYCNEMRLTHKMKNICVKIYNCIEELSIFNNMSQTTLFPVIIYFVIIQTKNKDITLDNIIEKFNVTKNTIIKHYNTILANKVLIFNYINKSC